MDKRLCKLFPGLRPWEVDDWTVPEIAFGLSIETGQEGGMGGADILAELQRWKELTPRQRLREAMERRANDG